MAILVLCATCLFGWPSVAEQQSSSTHATEHKAEETAHQMRPSSAAINLPTFAPCNQANPCYTKDSAAEEQPPKWRRPEWVSVYITGVYAVISFLTLLAIKHQALLMKQSADLSRGATVPTLRILNFHLGGSDPLVHHEMELTVRNYGASPAILDVLYISFDEGERWPTGEGESVSFSETGGRAVAAHSEAILQSAPYLCLVSPNLIDRFRREQRSIYAHGRLKYLDVFDSPTRSLRFSVHLNQTQNGTIQCQITNQWNEYEK